MVSTMSINYKVTHICARDIFYCIYSHAHYMYTRVCARM